MKTKAAGTPLPGKTNPRPTPSTSRQKPDSHTPCYQSLKGKHLFLDLRGYNGAAAFESKLRFLGATIEKCFSRDINYLITSRGATSDYARRRGTKVSLVDGASSPAVPSPFSVCTRSGGTTDSPRTDSPRGMVDGTHKPMTRGMSIAQKANLTKNYGSTDVLESARKWGIKIVHIDQAQSWIAREYDKLPASVTQSLAKDKSRDKKKPFKVRRLRGHFIKFEVTSGQFRPVHQQFTALPAITFHTSSSCPFPGASTGGQHLLERAEVAGGGLLWKDTQTTASSSSNEVNVHRPNAARKTTCKRVRASPRGAAAKATETPSGGVHGVPKAKFGKEHRYGFCELCHMKYENIEKHLRSDRHREMVRDAAIFESLDRRIAMAPDLDQLKRDVMQ